jgi:RNA polymerase sigma-70 factor (ECF subfamily)
MNLEQERLLVERARNSQEAFGELYDMYYDRIFGYALRRSADIEAANDITSAVFFKALKHIKNYRWEGIPFSHWLYRVANREIVDRYNRGKRETNYDMSRLWSTQELRDEVVSGESILRMHEAYLDLQGYISKLPSKYQEVITLRYFEDLDIKQIAGILHKPEGTIKSLLHRSIEKLRMMMEP